MRIVLFLALVLGGLFGYLEALKKLPSKYSEFIPQFIFGISGAIYAWFFLLTIHTPINAVNGYSLNDLEFLDFPYVLIPIPTNNWEALSFGVFMAYLTSSLTARMIAYRQSKKMNKSIPDSNTHAEGKLQGIVFVFSLLGAIAAGIEIYKFFFVDN